MIRYIFGAYFKQFSLSFPDVNKNKGVAETAPLIIQRTTFITETSKEGRGRNEETRKIIIWDFKRYPFHIP